MNLFQFNQFEMLTFFAVLVRFSVLMVIFPIFGDRVVPTPVKILLSFSISIVVFPSLVRNGYVSPDDAAYWGSSAGLIAKIILLEAVFGVALAFTSRIVFDAIQIGGDLIGIFMGLSSANIYDPHQESNTQIVGKLKVTLASVLFITLNAHYILLKASIESYRFVGLGKVDITGSYTEKLVSFTSELIRLGVRFAAPMAVALFSINIVYAVLAKALPQLNVLVLSFAVSSFVGLFVIFLGMPEFVSVAGGVFNNSGSRLTEFMVSLSGK